MRPSAPADQQSVFLNIPFDREYSPLFVALIASLTGLGGTPTTTPSAVKPARDSKEKLRNALEDEIETLDRYVLRRRQAEALGHYGLAVEFDDLIRDESTHRDEIQMILKRWDTG